MLMHPSPAQIGVRLKATILHRVEAFWTQPIRGVSTDSRQIQPGDAFVALRGDRFDGHEFVVAVAERGARVAVVDDRFAGQQPERMAQLASLECSVLRVPNTLVAYQDLGRWWRENFTGPVIAVTGSVGKTTTKELIAAVLATQGPVLKTEANYNNEIGVPKTLLDLEPHHRYAVIEMGMRGRGQIAELTQIAQPDIAVITTVGTAHIELLGSVEAIAEAKCELLAELPRNGIAVLNADNGLLMQTAERVWAGEQLSFGLGAGMIRGEIVDPEHLEVHDQRFVLPLPGRHNASNFLAALAVAEALGIDWAALTQLQVSLPGGRARRYTLANDVVLLDETYNAGLESMQAALQLLAETPGQRRIAVLGTMKELGDYSIPLHRQVGETVAQLGLDSLLVLADPAEAEALTAGAAPVPSQCFDSPSALIQGLQGLIQPGDRLLFKASRAVALDQVVTGVRTALGDSLGDSLGS